LSRVFKFTSKRSLCQDRLWTNVAWKVDIPGTSID
jgi:hypothetical protein